MMWYKEDMKRWEAAVSKFIKPWYKRGIIGVIVSGSYVIGTASKNSDIDLHIILPESAKYKERGNQVVDGFLIEYFANPIGELRRYFFEDRKKGKKLIAHMLSTGRILFDKDASIKTLQDEATMELKKGFDKIADNKVEMAKYFLWDSLDSLKGLKEQASPSYNFYYSVHLEKIIDTYSMFCGLETPNMSKLYNLYSDEACEKKYNIELVPDGKFKQLVIKAIENYSLKVAEDLTNYVLHKMGGFEIDGWKLISTIK